MKKDFNNISYDSNNKLITFSFNYNISIINNIRNIIGRKYNPIEKNWTINLTKDNFSQIKKFIDKFKPEFKEKKDKQLLFEIFELDLEEKKKKELENFNFEKSNSIFSDFEIKGLPFELRPFQKVGVEYIIKNKGVIIGDEMGLGKTIETLASIHYLNIKPVLIVCPDTLKYNWLRETNKWLPNKKVFLLKTEYNLKENLIVLTGKIEYPLNFVKLYKDGLYKMTELGFRKIKEKENLKESNIEEAIIENYNLKDYDIIIASYNTININEKFLKNINWKMIVADESHFLKNSQSNRTNSILELSKNIEYVVLLSGTSVTNRPSELISQLQIINKLKDFGGWYKFVTRYCNAYRGNWGWDLSGSSNLEELHKNLRKICYIRRNKKEVLTELPDKQKIIIEVDISNRKEYDKAEEDLISYLKEELLIEENRIKNWEREGKTWEEIQLLIKEYKQEKINSANKAEHLVRINLLKQLVAEGKIQSIKEWIDNFLRIGEKLIVFAEHTKLIKELSDYYKCGRIFGETKSEDRQKLVDEFQNNMEIKLLFLNTKVGGVGLTLTSSSNVLFLELGWTPSEHDQAEDRLHRIGQKDSVNCYYMLGKNTIDNWIYDLIEEKRIITNAVNSGEFIEDQNKGMLNELINKFLNK